MHSDRPTDQLDGAVLLATRIGTHLVKIFPTFYGTQSLIAMPANDSHLSLLRARPVLDVLSMLHVSMNDS